MRLFRHFAADTRAASAAEFALVLPAALILLFGIIDSGRYVWQLAQYEKATQMGVRYAVVTTPVSELLADPELTFVDNPDCGATPLRAGDRICADAFPPVICNADGCDRGTRDLDAFTALVGRMRTFQPRINASQVAIEYRGSGIGFADDPNKPEISPIVTVRVNGARFSPIVLIVFGGTVALPDFSYSLTLEDAQGSVSN